MIRLNLSLLFMLLFCNVSLSSVIVSWDAPTTNVDGTPLTDLEGYRVYYDTISGRHNNMTDVGNVITYTINTLDTGQYFFVVTAYDNSGNESDFSDEVNLFVLDLDPPQKLKLRLKRETLIGKGFVLMDDDGVVISFDGIIDLSTNEDIFLKVSLGSAIEFDFEYTEGSEFRFEVRNGPLEGSGPNPAGVAFILQLHDRTVISNSDILYSDDDGQTYHSTFEVTEVGVNAIFNPNPLGHGAWTNWSLEEGFPKNTGAKWIWRSLIPSEEGGTYRKIERVWFKVKL